MNSSPATQPSLLVRIRDAKDHEAWERFVDLYAPLVYGFLRKRGLQDADAADLMQDVLRSVSVAAKSFVYDPGRGSFRSWLFLIVQNRLADHWRRDRLRERGSGDSDAVKRLEDLPDPAVNDLSHDWDTEYERQLFHYVANAIRPDVSEATWNAFWWTAVDGMAGRDVAEKLGMSVAAVYLAKSRVMARLKEQIRLLVGEETI